MISSHDLLLCSVVSLQHLPYNILAAPLCRSTRGIVHMNVLHRSLLSLLLLSGTVMATDDPFVGKWRFSTKKSNYNGLRIRYEKAGEHSYKFYDANEVAHEKIADGKEHPGEMGNTYLVRQDNATTWIFITKEPDGTVLNTTRKVTNNGRTMTATWHDTKPDGKVETG